MKLCFGETVFCIKKSRQSLVKIHIVILAVTKFPGKRAVWHCLNVNIGGQASMNSTWEC